MTSCSGSGIAFHMMFIGMSIDEMMMKMCMRFMICSVRRHKKTVGENHHRLS